MSLNPNWLKTFMVLAQTGHFTQTANLRFMTQPGVSQHIAKLEAYLGVQLLHRDNKYITLTDAGKRLYLYAEKVFEAETEFLATISQDNPYAGECTIGCSGTLALIIYPHLIELQAQYPELIIRLEAAPNARINQAIIEDKLDFGIVTHKLPSGLIRYEPIFEVALQLILPSQFTDQAITIDKLNQLGFIDHPDGQYYLKQVVESNFLSNIDDEVKEQTLFNIRSIGYINQISQILLPVSKGIGFTVMPASILQTQPASISIYTPNLLYPVNESYFFASKINNRLAARHKMIYESVLSFLVSSLEENEFWG
ncbi:LysR family transcriptional regulator [Thorsellia kenyensis]|uniref:LysR family transcriptional regulator n=1 Tax=Thorsellia kenyensis TaxID=1549888 RepID=A0ABV6CAV3_9GAMM